MSIAKKLTEVAENVPKVYESGWSKGVTQGYSTGYQQGEEAGKQAEYDAFWDTFQQNGMRKNYANAFGGTGWTDTLFKPKYDIQITDGYMMFRSTKVTDLSNLSVLLDFSKSTNMQYMFQWAETKHIGVIDMSNMGSKTQGMLCYTYYLRTIDKIIVHEGVTFANDAFSNSTALANITFEGVIGNSIDFQWSPLTKASITNVIEHLSSTATGQTVTFNKTAKEAAFTAEEWSELIAGKTNWTFSLV